MIIWGFRKNAKAEWAGLLKCPQCDRWRLHHGIRTKRYGTIFFAPILPLWGDHHAQCAVCLHREKLDRLAFEALGQAAKRNVELADRYRDNPAELQRQLELASQDEQPLLERSA